MQQFQNLHLQAKRIAMKTKLIRIIGILGLLSTSLWAGTPVQPNASVGRARLTASDGMAQAELGFSVAVSGTTVVAGAPDAIIGANTFQGAAYVFVKPPSGWVNMRQTAKLTASDGANFENLGWSIAIAGDTIVIGVPHTPAATNHGAAYVFVKPQSGWADMTETAKLTASDETDSSYFGTSVAVSGNTVVVATPVKTVGGNQSQGCAYVFVKPPSGWVSTTETARLTASDGAAFDALGGSVAISGNTIVAGAYQATIGSNFGQGAAYVFVKPGNGWVTGTQTAKLTASDGAAISLLGQSVSISGDIIVAGAPWTTIGNKSQQGAAYVFVKPPTGWVNGTQAAKLTASDGTGTDIFGQSVGISGKTVIAGAPNHVTNFKQGAAYVFLQPNGGWINATETVKLVDPNGKGGDQMGWAVGVSGNTLISGAYGATVGSNAAQGMIYLFFH